MVQNSKKTSLVMNKLLIEFWHSYNVGHLELIVKEFCIHFHAGIEIHFKCTIVKKRHVHNMTIPVTPYLKTS